MRKKLNANIVEQPLQEECNPAWTGVNTQISVEALFRKGRRTEENSNRLNV